MVDKEGGPSMEDAAGFFANVFGGDRFVDYVRRLCILPYGLLTSIQIGEISLMKEMTNVASTMMTDEEKVDMERQFAGQDTQPTVTPRPSTPEPKAEPATTGPTSVASAVPAGAAPTTAEEQPEDPPVGTQSTSLSVPNASSPTPSASSKEKDKDPKDLKERKRPKLTPEQKKKLEALEKERREAMEKRVKDLHRKLVERYNPRPLPCHFQHA